MVARRVEGVQIERTADEILAVKEGSLEAHAINQSAAAVYDLCDGNTSKFDMAAEIHRRTGLPADDEIVDLALSELVETGLVILDDSEPRSAVSRRALIRRLALSSTLALMLPVVETIVVPPAEMAANARSPTPTPTEIDLVRGSYRAFDASSAIGRGPSRNQIVIAKRLSANASVSQHTGHTSRLPVRRTCGCGRVARAGHRHPGTQPCRKVHAGRRARSAWRGVLLRRVCCSP